MGSFSWLFADTNNTKNLRANRRGYVACPDGTFICEPCYETYGIFDGNCHASNGRVGEEAAEGCEKRLHSIRFRGYVAALWLSWYHSSQGW